MTKWWELPRQTIYSLYNSGDLVPDVVCPECQSRVLYNGNYFCEDWGMEHRVFKNGKTYGERVGGPCDWALAVPAETKADKEICDKLGLDYE